MGNLGPNESANVTRVIGAAADGTETEYIQVEVIDGQRRLLTETIGTITAAADSGEVYAVSVSSDIERDVEADLILLRNPVASGHTTKMLRLDANVLENNDDVLVVRFYSTATFSAPGAAVTTNSSRIGSAVSATTLVTEIPTITGRGTFLFSKTFKPGGPTVQLFSELFQVEDNNNILLTVEMKGTTREWNIELWFDEKTA